MSVTTYDQIPYATRPIYSCHPDCLAVMGVLLGMTPAPLARCRMLEIGCSSAGNLIPIALQFPGSQFVGLDLSPVQIASGKEVVQGLGIANLDLRAQSLMDIDESWGQFDYIVCHGVFSWVPDVVREKILAVCRQNLAPQGVAYISYNTFPGWYVRKTLRDMLNLHVSRFPEPTVRVAQARQFMEFLDKTGLPEVPYANPIRELIADLRKEPDYYFFHEYLETENQPFYFSEFMARARAADLQYMGNAQSHIDLDLFNPGVKQALIDISEDLVQLEQFTDFLANRPFRRSLLCHANIALDRTPSPGVLSRLHVSARAEPVSPSPDCFSNAPETFHIKNKKHGTTDQPLTKTLFTFIAEIWPNSIPFDSLWIAIRDRLAAHNCLSPELAAAGPIGLAQTLLQAFLGDNFVALHVEPFPLTTAPGLRPRALRLARWQVAKSATEIANLRHAIVELDGIDRIILPLLDGSRTNDQVFDVLAQLVLEGKLSLTDDAGQRLAGESLRTALSQTLTDSFARLARKGLLEA